MQSMRLRYCRSYLSNSMEQFEKEKYDPSEPYGG
jgi:hypothetical protein